MAAIIASYFNAALIDLERRCEDLHRRYFGVRYARYTFSLG